MSHPQFSLLTEPWIPVRDTDGRIQTVGLRELLVRSHEFQEIAHDSPLFVAAMIHLCIAVLHRALAGSSDQERKREWRRLWKQGYFEVAALDAYFSSDHCKDRFDLFHPEYPFYQTAGLRMTEASPLSRLAMEENNAPAMFANTANPEWSRPSPALAAQLLVSIQSFALGFGKSSRASIGSEDIEPPYSADGPLLRGLTVWLSSNTLFETLMLNLVPHELPHEDRPCWELERPYELRDRLTSAGRVCVSPKGICDVATYNGRLILLRPEVVDGEIVVPTAYFTQGRSIEKSSPPYYHPSKIYKESKQTGITALALNENKAIWRNAHALLSTDDRVLSDRSPLKFISRELEDGYLKDSKGEKLSPALQVVGMASDPGKAGKFLLWRHDRIPLPQELLLQQKLVGVIYSALNDSEAAAIEMRFRFARVAKTFISPDKNAHTPDPKDVNALVDKFDPRRAYWPLLENHFYQLLVDLPKDETGALQTWQRQVERAAESCFRAACNNLGYSPTAIVAVAQVGQRFSIDRIRAGQSKGSGKGKKALAA